MISPGGWRRDRLQPENGVVRPAHQSIGRSIPEERLAVGGHLTRGRLPISRAVQRILANQCYSGRQRLTESIGERNDRMGQHLGARDDLGRGVEICRPGHCGSLHEKGRNSGSRQPLAVQVGKQHPTDRYIHVAIVVRVHQRQRRAACCLGRGCLAEGQFSRPHRSAGQCAPLVAIDPQNFLVVDHQIEIGIAVDIAQRNSGSCAGVQSRPGERRGKLAVVVLIESRRLLRVANDEIQIAVTGHVTEGDTGREFFFVGLPRGNAAQSAAVVQIQHIGLPASADRQIQVAIVVDIAQRQTGRTAGQQRPGGVVHYRR